MTPAIVAVALGVSLVLGVGVPWVAMRLLTPTLARSEGARAVNFRGTTVFYGLGLAWLIWAGCAIIGGIAAEDLLDHSLAAVLTIAGPLVLVAFSLGIVDDAFGSGADRGFRGHLRALFAGRLTTGGLKLIGIGVASLVVSYALREFAPWGTFAGTKLGIVGSLVAVLLAGASIALTSNLLNLMDLRPGRALKSYVALGSMGVASTAVLALPPRVAHLAWSSRLLDAAILALFVLGPALATWRLDLGERGMLGDAGANPMGALVGLLIVFGLPWWGLALYFLAVFGLNLASERYSFSRLIESNAVLSWLDRLGRPRTGPESETNPG